MVATRRGVRVYSPTKTESNQSSNVQATPSTGRRTRRTAKGADSPTQHAFVETSSQLDKGEEGSPTSPPTSSLKRCTRASRLHSPQQPSTPVSSTHEADMSDLESCCSVVSEVESLVTRIRSRRRQPRTVSQEEEEISEVESCSSAMSASKRSSRRSTRKKTVPESSDSTCVEKEDVKVVQVLETESCSSLVSESKRVTRSQKKTARSLGKQLTEDSEVSDADSCMSSVSGADISKSTTRRATRSTRQTRPIPMHLDEASESSQSPAPTGRRTRAARGKPAASADASEPHSCDSEGFESGPTYSMATRRRGKTQSTVPKAIDTESELTDVHSPVGSSCLVQDRGTPCSSRTGSGNSTSQSTPASRRSVKDLSMVVEKDGEPSEEDNSLNDSRLESTVIAEDADCTFTELGEEKGVNVISDGDTHLPSLLSDMAGCAEEAVTEPAVIIKDQQEELSTENKDGETSEMEMMQEIFPSSKPLKPCQSVPVPICDKASEITEEKNEAVEDADVDAQSSKTDKNVDADAGVETQHSVVEKMEVSTSNTDDQQVVDSSESIQVPSRQQHKITVDSDSEKQITDVIVQNAKVISLLDSDSDSDEDEYDEEEEEEVDGSEEDDLGNREEEKEKQSKKSESTAESVKGLFMIDTRPGQDADEHYYKERATEQEEGVANKDSEHEAQDEEFVDEEGDDDDDEDAKILFSSRDPLTKELSSRIDPGIRVKALGGLYINFDGSKSKPVSTSLLKEKKIQDEVMKKSVIGPDFEKKDAVPPYSESKQALKLKRREERSKSTGDGWFNMKAPEVSQELKGDLQVLKMRGSMDPKRFYKKNDRDGFPKYFQIGTVVDSAVDFYHSRIPKKERKRTMVEELLADAEFRQNNKKKYQHIVMEKAAQGAGKRNKKKNKFHKK